jgi:methyl-accepting chemotaxis protein
MAQSRLHQNKKEVDMNIKEEFTQKKTVMEKDINFGAEVTKRVVLSNMCFEILTMAACISMGIGELRIIKLPSIIGLGVLICMALHALALVMGIVLVTQAITEDLSSFY